MSDAKLTVTIGTVSFSGEGSEIWLTEQLKLILDHAGKPADATQAPSAGLDNGLDSTLTKPAGDVVGGSFAQSLASYLAEKNPDSSQVLRFLVTADWLRRRGQELSTRAVTKALKANKQNKLNNPADCLGQNIGKGLIEKNGGSFFITPEGLKNLGHSA